MGVSGVDSEWKEVELGDVTLVEVDIGEVEEVLEDARHLTNIIWVQKLLGWSIDGSVLEGERCQIASHGQVFLVSIEGNVGGHFVDRIVFQDLTGFKLFNHESRVDDDLSLVLLDLCVIRLVFWEAYGDIERIRMIG